MDLTPVDIVGKRCYHFIHAEDVEGIRHSHLDCKYCILIKIITLLLKCATELILIFQSVDLYILSDFICGWVSYNKHIFLCH